MNQEHLKKDLLAGVVVFLVALPLCLGIALASGAPIISGIITGVVGGLVVALLSGSQVSVSGPAAGLAVIVATAIQDLGSFELFLTAVFLSGVFQLIMGVLRAGTLSAFFPNSVIHGMLAAIGITIVLKQIPHALGTDSDYEGDLNFYNITDHENTFTEIGKALGAINPMAVLVAAAGFAVIFLWPRLQKKAAALEFIPPALMVVVVGLLINSLLFVLAPGLALMGDHVVSIPADAGFGFMFAGFTLPSLQAFTDPQVLIVAFTIAVVGSIETLLCLEATDKLDPKQRGSDGNQELLAQGVGNCICGFLGGIPMTSVIVRSSANIYAGAETRYSAFFHGVFLLVCVALLGPILNKLPLASLATILCVVGYRLASPAVFRKVMEGGRETFVPFIVTIGTVILTDLLKGVLVGLVVAFVLLLKSTVYGAVIAVHEGKDYFIKFTKDVSFSNKAYFRRLLQKIPTGATVFIDGSKAMFIDRDIYEAIDDFKNQADRKDIRVELIEVTGKEYHLVNRKREKWNEALSRSSITS